MNRSVEPSISQSRGIWIAIFSAIMIALSLGLRFTTSPSATIVNLPLWLALGLGGLPLVWDLLVKLARREFGSDLLAGISIITSILLGEYLAGTLVVLMLSGGEALEAYAVRGASSVLRALSRRMPAAAHKKLDGRLVDVPLAEIQIGDLLSVLPHETCPVDGIVVDGHGTMDESYLTGEPYLMSKTPGSNVLSGAINGEVMLTIRSEKRAIDSRYAKIMQVMRAAEEQRPQMRRLADRLGAFYTPIALTIGVSAWLATANPMRFLAVMVVATPCPLLVAIPVAIIGSISLAAKRAIIIRDPSALEIADTCRTLIFDKTGTLTYGQPKLVAFPCAPGFDPKEVLRWVASAECYSKHPLAHPILRAAQDAQLDFHNVVWIGERPGEGLRATVEGHDIQVTSRGKLTKTNPELASKLPESAEGLECIALVDGVYAATFQFRDAPREDGAPFIHHLSPRHQITRTMLVSGDRDSEVQYLAREVGIENVYGGTSPEEKLEIVRKETARAPTMFVGDGINDAPALMMASVGIAFGPSSDVTMEAADVVIMDSSLQKIDEFLHIGRRMRRIALQSAIGGMVLSVLGMAVAAAGYLPPVLGALAQEFIDVISVLNALRAAIPPKALYDYDAENRPKGSRATVMAARSHKT